MNYEITHPIITSHDGNDDDFTNRGNYRKNMTLFNFGCLCFQHGNEDETIGTKKTEQTYEYWGNNRERKKIPEKSSSKWRKF